MSWLKRITTARIRTDAGGEARKRNVPEGLWEKCEECGAVLYARELEENLQVCPKCAHHMAIRARPRLHAFLDAGTLREIGGNLQPVDVLKFKDQKKYSDRIKAAQKSSGESEGLIAYAGTLKQMPIVASAFDFGFMAGSMGSVVGERFALGVEEAVRLNAPFVNFAASGGARMQESLFSLMQMAKTSAALARLRDNGLPYISVLTHPTTGGVSASLAMLGDINIGEPKALIGFAGPRVIEQTIREKLPEGFQRSEFLLEHGAIDQICDRRELRDRIASLLSMLGNKPAPAEDAETLA